MDESRTTRVFHNLLSYIVDHPVRPGEALPAERRLADMFNASRNSVREALRMLQSRNVVEVRKGSGCYVTRHILPEDLDQFSVPVSHSSDYCPDLKHQIEARALVVPRLVHLAMPHMNDEYMERLEQNLVGLSQAILARDIEKIIEEDTRFNRILAHATGNSILQEILQSLEYHSCSAREIFIRMTDRQVNDLFAGYVGVLNALRTKNTSDVETHVQGLLDIMKSITDENGTANQEESVKEERER
jgi:DNA-binding FadR family transcriptional regulator